MCSRVTQSLVFFTFPTSPFFLLLSNFYFWMFLWKLEGLGLKGLKGSSLSAKLGNTQPLVSIVGQARPYLQTFSQRRKQAQNMARLGILSGHLVSEPSDLPRAICWPILLAHRFSGQTLTVPYEALSSNAHPQEGAPDDRTRSEGKRVQTHVTCPYLSHSCRQATLGVHPRNRGQGQSI